MAQWISQQFHLHAACKYERDRMRPAAKYEPALKPPFANCFALLDR